MFGYCCIQLGKNGIRSYSCRCCMVLILQPSCFALVTVYYLANVGVLFDIPAAREFCPVRYAAMQRWFEFSRSTLCQIEPKLLRMFHWPLGPLKTTPVCPVAIAVNFMPTTSAQSYTSSYRSCNQPAFYRMPFFLDRMGPKYSEWTTSAHEARPGHHLQSQGRMENFL